MSTSTPPGQFFSLADLGLPTSQTEFLQIWLQALQAAFPSYNPSAGDLEYIQAQVFAAWAADVAQLCSAGATELFRQFGTQLLGLPYQNGTAALAIVNVTATDTAGYTLPAGSQVSLTLFGSLVGFQTLTDLVIPMGESSGTVTVQAVQAGTAFNGAGTPAGMLSQIDWVTGVTVVTSASGGVDQEDDDQYIQRVAQTLQLLAPRPITASDYATMAVNFIPASGTDQEEVGRATAIDGYDPTVTSFTGTTNGTTTVSAVSSFAGISVGSVIAATDITGGQTVTAINTGASTLTLSDVASSSHSSEAMTATGSYGNEREVTVCISDATGNALNSDTLAAEQAYLENLREVNFIVNVVSPSYTTVYVTVTVSPSPGYSTATVQANVQAALLNYLNPSNFGLPQGALTGWNNSQTVHLSRLATVIQNASGVDYLQPGTLAVGTSASPGDTTTDLQLGGAFPLPLSTTASIPTSGITVL